MFGTPDLYDEKNMRQVASSIHALGRLLQTIMPDAPYPKLGIKIVEKNERHFSEEQMVQARMAVSVMNLGSSDMGRKAFTDVLSGEGFGFAKSGAGGAAAEPAAPLMGPKASKGTGASSSQEPEQPPVAAAAIVEKPTVAKAAAAAKSSKPTGPKPKGYKKAHERGAGAGSAGGPTLPSGWTEEVDDSGDIFYFNEGMGLTQWELPKPALPPNWREEQTDEGETYYVR